MLYRSFSWQVWYLFCPWLAFLVVEESPSLRLWPSESRYGFPCNSRLCRTLLSRAPLAFRASRHSLSNQGFDFLGMVVALGISTPDPHSLGCQRGLALADLGCTVDHVGPTPANLSLPSLFAVSCDLKALWPAVLGCWGMGARCPNVAHKTPGSIYTFWPRYETTGQLLHSEDGSNQLRSTSVCWRHSARRLSTSSEWSLTWNGERTETHSWCCTVPLFVPSLNMVALCMAQHQTPTYDNWTAFITLDRDWHWESSCKKRVFFYLIWCNSLTSTSPQMCTILSDLSNY